jgi:hypothetical protein
VSLLLQNFNFDKWLQGHLQTNVRGISTPLVFRYVWDNDLERVAVFYKHGAADRGTFEKDEWGPWRKEWTTTTNQETGLLERVQVLRTDPRGVDLECSPPDFQTNPGVEDWKDDEAWDPEKVFSSIARWAFPKGESSHHQSWAALRHWHETNKLSAAIDTAHTSISVGNDAVPLPGYTWERMWGMLESVSCDGPRQTMPSTSHEVGPYLRSSEGGAPKHLDRAVLAASHNLSVINAVANSYYPDATRNKDALLDKSAWLQHFETTSDSRDQLWLFHLPHFEGELAIGLGKRTFAETAGPDEWAVEWFERASKNKYDWGRLPLFKHAVASFESKTRKPVRMTSVEPIAKLVPIPVALTRKCTDERPVLTTSCLNALREWAHENGAWQDVPPPKLKALASKSTGKRLKPPAESEIGSSDTSGSGSETVISSGSSDAESEYKSGEEEHSYKVDAHARRPGSRVVPKQQQAAAPAACSAQTKASSSRQPEKRRKSARLM